MRRPTHILTALLLGLMPAHASAQSVSCERSSCSVSERVYRDGKYFVQEITGTLPAQPKLSVETDAGWIKVLGGKERDRVSFRVHKRVRAGSEEQARRYFEDVRFKAYTASGVSVLRGETAGAGRNAMLEMEIHTPRNIDHAIGRTRGGSVDISGIDGRAVAESLGGFVRLFDIGGAAAGSTMGGSIDADRIGGDARLETAGGSINIGSVNGNIVANTAGGSISVAHGKGNVSVETAGGSIGVKECSGSLKASTAGGSIDVGKVGAGARLETAGGSIRLTSAGDLVKAVTSGGGIKLARLTRGVHAETMAGGIEAEFIATRSTFTDSRLVTNVGDILVYLPSDLGVTVRATIEMSNGHRVISEFDEVKTSSDGGDYGPRTIYGNGAINGGGPVLKLNTSNGNIVLKRLRR